LKRQASINEGKKIKIFTLAASTADAIENESARPVKNIGHNADFIVIKGGAEKSLNEKRHSDFLKKAE
jgi:hypothetical protein